MEEEEQRSGAEQELAVGLGRHRRTLWGLKNSVCSCGAPGSNWRTGYRVGKLCLKKNECLRGLDLGLRIGGEHK